MTQDAIQGPRVDLTRLLRRASAIAWFLMEEPTHAALRYTATRENRMNRSYVWQLAVFVLILIGLNFFFRLHISIIGSLVLTLVLSFVFSAFRRRR